MRALRASLATLTPSLSRVRERGKAPHGPSPLGEGQRRQARGEVLLALLAGLALGACRPTPTGPEGAYQEFLGKVAAARGGKGVDLLESFDAPSQALLRERAKSASQATGDFMPADPNYQLVQGAPPPAGVAVRVVSQSESEATLEAATDAGVLGQIKLVREGGRWKIHLGG